MKKKSFRFIVCTVLALMLLASVSADVFSAEERYQAALTQLNSYLGQNQGIDLDAVIREFTDLAGYRESGGFLLYTEVIRQLDSPEPNEVLIRGWLNAVSQNEPLKSVLESETFRKQYSCIRGIDELNSYVSARLAEQRWNSGAGTEELENALALYLACLNFSDAAFRYSALLQVQIAITPTPVPETPVPETPVPETPAPEPEAPAWPVVELSRIQIRQDYSWDDSQLYGYFGPGRDYPQFAYFRLSHIRDPYALYAEGGFTLTDFSYPSRSDWNGRVCAYFPDQRFQTKDAPELLLQAVPGVITGQVIPRFGPGEDYASFSDDRFTDADSVTLEENTGVSVWLEADGWLLIEFSCSRGNVRGWIPCTSAAAE